MHETKTANNTNRLQASAMVALSASSDCRRAGSLPEHVIRQVEEATIRFATFAGITTLPVPGYMLSESGEPLAGYEWLDD
ncbi:hypothetical protein [Ruegeria sp. SCP11]|uniref:hypothetical protein n=1 Tax=Ruegeria sp. SCP11 TaxID=3141378 RepID=UPI00333800E1